MFMIKNNYKQNIQKGQLFNLKSKNWKKSEEFFSLILSFEKYIYIYILQVLAFTEISL